MATHWDSILQVTKRIALVARGFSSYEWAYGRTYILDHLTLINFVVHFNQPCNCNFNLHIVSMPEGNAFCCLSLAWCSCVSMVLRNHFLSLGAQTRCLWGRRSVIAWWLHSKTRIPGKTSWWRDDWFSSYGPSLFSELFYTEYTV